MDEGGIRKNFEVIGKADKFGVRYGSELAEGQIDTHNKWRYESQDKSKKCREHKNRPVSFYCFCHFLSFLFCSCSVFPQLHFFKKGRVICARPSPLILTVHLPHRIQSSSRLRKQLLRYPICLCPVRTQEVRCPHRSSILRKAWL